MTSDEPSQAAPSNNQPDTEIDFTTPCIARAYDWLLGGNDNFEVVTPMFPLGSVLVPGMVLPLHVFEPRYLRLVEDCQAGDGRFGVVLIERGSEVGGGDVRTDVGTLARIVRADELDDGRWMLLAVGEQRIRVDQWLPDDPYPRAEVSEWPDDQHRMSSETAAGESPPVLAGDWDAVNVLLRRAAALSWEIGAPAPPLDLELADDPVLASYQAAAVSPSVRPIGNACWRHPRSRSDWPCWSRCWPSRSSCCKPAWAEPDRHPVVAANRVP